MLVLSFPFSTPLIDNNIQLDSAYIVHISSSLFFTFGYLLKLLVTREAKRFEATEICASKKFFFISYVLLAWGLFVTIWQVSVTTSPLEYITGLFSGRFNPSIREAFLRSSSSGGLSGVLKMFHTVPLGIYLQSTGIIAFFRINNDDKRRFTRLNRVSLIALLVKVLFSLDRLTIMGIVIAHVYIIVKKKKVLNAKYIATIALVVAVGGFLSRNRLEGYGLFDFLILYTKSGIVNLQLMISTLTGNTYGFSTILGPVNFVLSALKLSTVTFFSSFAWEWNPAQYIVSYAYQDFGNFYFLFFFVLGYLAKKVDVFVHQKNNKFYISIYFILLYAIISFISVPVIRSVEFWLMIIVALFMSKLLVIPNAPRLPRHTKR